MAVHPLEIKGWIVFSADGEQGKEIK